MFDELKPKVHKILTRSKTEEKAHDSCGKPIRYSLLVEKSVKK
jgi:hypothetical protein